MVILTGATSGIGRALASAWTERAARLVLNARSAEGLEAVAAECRTGVADAIVVAGDVTRSEVQRALLDAALTGFGRLDVLVNHAGAGLDGAFESLDAATVREVLEVNAVAPLALTQRALPALERARGTVVMMSSIAGLVAMPGSGGYAASKFALEALSASLRAELAAQGSGVRVCVVRPGLAQTPFAEVARETLDAVDRGRPEVDLPAGARALVALGRVSRPALRAVLARMAPPLGVPRRRG